MGRTPATPGRANPAKLSKPFPWATVVGSVLLGAALIGIIAYAVLNQGSGIRDVVRNPDGAIKGVVVADEESSRNHVDGPVQYEQTPPNAGVHNPVPQQCGLYRSPIAPEHALHSLEHGAVWITINATVSDDDVEEIAQEVNGDPYVLLSPLPEQTSPINLSAWGRRLSVDTVDDPRIDDFIEGYASGPQSPERGAACTGNTTEGPVRAMPGTVPPPPVAPDEPEPQAPSPAG